MLEHDLVGVKINLLTVVEYLGLIPNNWGYNSDMVKCQCECGGFKNVIVSQFKSGHVKSCGCLATYHQGNFGKIVSRKTHGFTNHELFHTYCLMIKRCYDINDHAYKDYGGRGIKVCDEWKGDFMSFYNWAIKNGYEKHLTLDRFPDNDGCYEPNNCRWATKQEQANNRRSTRYVELEGKRMSMADACRKVGMTYKIINQRVVRDGLTFEEAIKTPIISLKC